MDASATSNDGSKEGTLDALANAEGEYPWVLCRLGDNIFCLTAELVESMVQLPAVTSVPNVPHNVRGVMNLRGRVMRVVDLRLSLGLPGLDEDVERFLDTIDARLGDHERWVDALEHAVHSRTSFTGERDPTRCAFGRWLKTLDTSDVVMQGLLERVRGPHEELHASAHKIDAAIAQGDDVKVEGLLTELHTSVLPTIQTLFSATKDAYRRSTREIALVLSDGRVSSAVVVDQVLSVEHLKPVDVDAERNALGGIDRIDLVRGMAKRPKSEDLVLILDADQLIAV